MAAEKPVIIEIGEADINVGRIMEKTEPFILTPKTLITVPERYYAVPYVDGKRLEKISPCQKKKLKNFIGSDKVGKSVSILYVSKTKLNTLPWGSGNLPVTYEQFGGTKLKVGANGTFLCEINNPSAFYESLDREYGPLNIDEVKSRVISAFRACISDIVVQLFCEAGEPVFETEFMIDELNRRINNAVCNKKAPNLSGVFFKSATVTAICVSEEDKAAFLDYYEKNKKNLLKTAKKS